MRSRTSSSGRPSSLSPWSRVRVETGAHRIDLAWDVIARFGPANHALPPAFFADWAKVALDESKHFSLLTARLRELGTAYGTLPVHASLWDSATDTMHALRARLAIIHLVHEARGLDVNPGTIARFARSGDDESVRVLEIIHAGPLASSPPSDLCMILMVFHQTKSLTSPPAIDGLPGVVSGMASTLYPLFVKR
jgi:hypothetical protein